MCSSKHLGYIGYRSGEKPPGSMGILEATRDAPEVISLSADPKACHGAGKGKELVVTDRKRSFLM